MGIEYNKEKPFKSVFSNTYREIAKFFLTFMTPSGYLVQNTCKLLEFFTFREVGFLHSGNLISKYLKVK